MFEDDKELEFEVSLAAQIPQADLFHRSLPASLEGPAEAWTLARSAIDFGCAVFAATTTSRVDHEVRDLVLAALLRRASVTAEGVVTLLAAGLQEPAMATTRTLLDIDLAFRLIRDDVTDRMAKRLAAYHYIAMQGHGQDMLADHTTRTDPLAPYGQVAEVQGIARSYKRLLQSGVLAEVEAEVRSSRFWHGYSNAEEAFRATGQVAEYHMTYDTATWFVHDANIEHDLIDRVGSAVTVRPFVERDPRIVLTLLGYAVLRYVEIVGHFIKERGLPETEHFKAPCEVAFPDGAITRIDPHTALSMRVSKFFSRQNDAEPQPPAL